ncbi:hypothetical protein OIU78_026233, partial [Salix suchowensis]
MQRSWPLTGERSQAVRVLEADGATKRGLLWLTAAGVVAEEEDEETRAEGAVTSATVAGRQICQLGCLSGQRRGEGKESEPTGRRADGVVVCGEEVRSWLGREEPSRGGWPSQSLKREENGGWL